MSDLVNHPDHYTRGGIETIDFIIAKGLSYELGNVVKYVSRAQFKGEYLQDLKKAQWYLNDAIKRAEQQPEEVEVDEELEPVRWPEDYTIDWSGMIPVTWENR